MVQSQAATQTANQNSSTQNSQNTAQTNTPSTPNFDTILQTLIKDANLSGSTREQGKLFERLVARILQTLSVFTNEFKEVYLWNEFSAKFGINSQDIGIDIMALTHGGEWASVQCKAYDTAHTLAQGDLRNFLGINNITKSSGEHFCDISQKLIFHTCKNESENFRKALEQTATSTSSAKSYGYYALKDLNVEWDALNLEDLSSLKMRGKKALRDYQKAALNAIKESFAHRSKEIKLEIHTQNGENKEKRVAQDRAQVIMACGTGKSLLSVRTIDALVGGGELALFFAPSLALINQMLIEFFKESESENYKVFAVCSDTNIAYSAANAITKDSEDIKAADISIPVISNPQNLAAQIKHYQAQGKKIVIFSTYQSIDCVIEAQKELLKNEANPQKFTFKLIINDEAHRTAGYDKLVKIEGKKKESLNLLDESGENESTKGKKQVSIWQKTHDNELLRAEFRLYMTATPRVYNDTKKDKVKASDKVLETMQENDLEIYSMDDEEIFGRVIYSLRFGDAITTKADGSDKNILCDYRVLITFINKDTTASLTNAKGKDYQTDDISKMLGLYKAILKQDLYLLEGENPENSAKTSENSQNAATRHSEPAPAGEESTAQNQSINLNMDSSHSANAQNDETSELSQIDTKNSAADSQNSQIILEKFSDDSEPMKRVVTFHRSIKNSQFFTQHFAVVDKNLKAELDENEKRVSKADTKLTRHIDGSFNANDKAAQLDWLKNADDAPFKILSNAKCLTEGIDVPNLDAVAFFDPRDSVVDIVQAVGRVMRQAPNKKYGYIILPIALSEKDILNYDNCLNSQAFKGIWKVLKALRSHDERLVDASRINQVVKIVTPKDKSPGSFDSGTKSDIAIQEKTKNIQNSLFALNELSAEIKNAIPKNLGDLAYWELYADKVGEIMKDLSTRIKDLITDEKNDKRIRAIFESFCKALKANLNASFDTNDAISLIAQHIITKPIFSHIFPNLDFAKFDKVSFELDKLYDELGKFGLKSELDKLKGFYNSIQKTAEYAQSDKAKQDLIRNLYDSLFKSAFKKTQEKLGIVYTPIEVVDFIIHSVEFALQKHFGKSLSDKGVHILDPFTGTGSFITRLIQSGLLDANLAHKYKSELWANEITLLAYYIAQLNITSVFHEKLAATQGANSNLSEQAAQTYQLFDNLLFTDTFETYDESSKGYIGKKRDKTLFEGEYFAKNLSKINEFKNQEFKVIFGNPPYSAGQSSANDDNKNTTYPALEARIAQTYQAKSLATKSKNTSYDTLKMAIRYASDRIQNAGIVAFVTNGSFIESNSDDGLRACLASEFDYIYIFNLRGNARTQGDARQKEGGGVFDSGSRTPVAISILVKCGQNSQENSQTTPSLRGVENAEAIHSDSNAATRHSEPAKAGEESTAQNQSLNLKMDSSLRATHSAQNDEKSAQIFYHDIGDYLDRQAKLNIIANFKSIAGIERAGKFTPIVPNADYDWINQRDYGYLNFMPMGNSSNKLKPLPKKNGKIEFEIFEIFSQGVVTGKDAWAFNFSKENLAQNIKLCLDTYNAEREKLAQNPKHQLTNDLSKVNWGGSLRKRAESNYELIFDKGKIKECLYRPFNRTWLYYDSGFNHSHYQMDKIYPNESCENLAICLNDKGSGKDFSALMVNMITEYAHFTNAQCFPLYYYEKIENAGSGNLFENSQNASTCHSEPAKAGEESTNGKESVNLNLDSSLRATHSAQNDEVRYRRKDGIRDEALAEIRRKYKDEKITKEDIFYYIYALLNHKGYKEKYKDNLSKMLPRIPFVKDFWGFCKIGRELAALHLNYENFAQSCRAKVVAKGEYKEASGLFGKDGGEFLANLNEGDFRLEKMRFVSKGKRDTIFFNDKIAITQIPQSAYDYVVNGRSGVEWIMERYQVKTDKDSGIKNDPNLYENLGFGNGAFVNLSGGADLTGLANSNGGVGGVGGVGFGGGSTLSGLKGGKYALYLLLSVIEMSALSVEILDKLADFGLDEVE